MRRIAVACYAGVLVCLIYANPALAQSLLSPHYEIDALNFAPSDSQLDFLPPVITAVTVTSTTGTASIIQWTTDVPSSSVVAFGLTTTYSAENGQSEDRVKSHSVKITGLSPNTAYHFQVKSADALGHMGKGTDQTLLTTNQLNISEVQASDITLNSAIITWKTASLISSSIAYGTTTSYGQKVIDEGSGSTTNHTIRLGNLNSGTTYHFQIIGFDADGVSNASDDYIFSTLALPQIVKYSIGTVTGNTAEILWETNTATDSFISFWKDGQDESTKQIQGTLDLVTKHRLIITGLVGKTVYKFRISGRDANGNKIETDPLSFTTPLDTTPPVITDIRSEISTSTKDDRLQLIVSWNTDEPAASQIEYNVGLPSNQTYKLQSIADSTLNLNHTLVLDKLKQSTNYHFRIKATDQAGNTGFSTDNSELTPQQQKSLLQIILEKLQETFGWLRNVKLH